MWAKLELTCVLYSGSRSAAALFLSKWLQVNLNSRRIEVNWSYGDRKLQVPNWNWVIKALCNRFCCEAWKTCAGDVLAFG